MASVKILIGYTLALLTIQSLGLPTSGRRETLKPLRSHEDPTSPVFGSKHCHHFQNLWDQPKIDTFRNLLIAVNSTFAANNIDWAIAHGTALGYARFGTFIPWDDDMDITVGADNWESARSLFTPPLCTYPWQERWHPPFWKVYFCDSPNAGSYPWKFPFIDVFEEEAEEAEDKYNIKVLPSKAITFAGLSLRGPENLEAVPLEYGNYADCTSDSWNHQFERSETAVPVTVPCWELMMVCGPQFNGAWRASSNYLAGKKILDGNAP